MRSKNKYALYFVSWSCIKKLSLRLISKQRKWCEFQFSLEISKVIIAFCTNRTISNVFLFREFKDYELANVIYFVNWTLPSKEFAIGWTTFYSGCLLVFMTLTLICASRALSQSFESSVKTVLIIIWNTWCGLMIRVIR